MDEDDITPGPEAVPEPDEPEPDAPISPSSGPAALDEPPGPVNWNLLGAEEAEEAWLELNRWVDWLRHEFGLPAAVIPPYWHRHPELVWELSALHIHWLCAYDPQQNGSAPIGWLRDFAESRQRLRDWVAASGTRLDRDRPTRQTVWPGEEQAEPIEDAAITDRDAGFVNFVVSDVARREQAEEEYYARLDPETGELTRPTRRTV